MRVNNYKSLLDKVEEVTKQRQLDLSSGEDLSIGIMNLISIEEHLFFTYNKTKNKKYIDLLNEVRAMRTDLMREIVKDVEGESWCISKHLLAACMRVMEVGTKELKRGNKEKARNLFEKSYKLYSLFWGMNLGVVNPLTKNFGVGVKMDSVKRNDNNVNLINEKTEKKASVSVFDKLGSLVQKAIDCCRE